MKKLPAKVFIKWDYPSQGEAYLIADQQMFGLVGTDGKTKIGAYQLIETVDAELVVSTSAPVKTR
ncbi:hypothetical protein [Bradyrhizobium sp.]